MIITADQNTDKTEILRLDKTVVEIPDTFRVHAKSGSKLKVVVIQNFDSDVEADLHFHTEAEEGAVIDLVQIHIGGKSIRTRIIQNTEGPDAEVNTDLLCRTKGSQEYKFDVMNVYKYKSGRGKIRAKGAASDNSRLTINGGIHITKNGGGTDAHLKQDSLLLSKNAKINATPALKIDTNDVKAGHGATVSNFDEESIFYLTARGVSPDEAKKMLLEGFVGEVLDRVDDELATTIRNEL